MCVPVIRFGWNLPVRLPLRKSSESHFIGSELGRIEAKNPACRGHSNQSQPGGL
jgi:hypothetical protein